jgi:hypothetical protein
MSQKRDPLCTCGHPLSDHKPDFYGDWCEGGDRCKCPDFKPEKKR